MDRQKEVISMIKSCIILRKGGMPMKDLEKEFRDLVGSNIPYKMLGHASLKEFLQSIPEVYSSGTNDQGDFVLHVKDEKLQHIQEMVSQQKGPKKKINKKYCPVSYSRPNFYSEHKKNTGYSHSKPRYQKQGYNNYQSASSSSYQKSNNYENTSARKPFAQNTKNYNSYYSSQKETHESSLYDRNAASALLSSHNTNTRKECEPYAYKENKFEEEQVSTSEMEKQNMVDLSSVEATLLMQSKLQYLKINTTHSSDIKLQTTTQSYEAEMPEVKNYNRYADLDTASNNEKYYPRQYIQRISHELPKNQMDFDLKEQTETKRYVSEISLNNNKPHHDKHFINTAQLNVPVKDTENILLSVPSSHIRKIQPIPYQDSITEAYSSGLKSRFIPPPPGFSLQSLSVTQDPPALKKEEMSTAKCISALSIDCNDRNHNSNTFTLKEKNLPISLRYPGDTNYFKRQLQNKSSIPHIESTMTHNNDSKLEAETYNQSEQSLPSKMESPESIPTIFNHQLIGDDFFVKLSQGSNFNSDDNLCISGLSIAACLKKIKSVQLKDQVLVLVGCIDILQDMPLKTMQILTNLLVQELSKKVKRAVLFTLPPLIIEDSSSYDAILNKYNRFNNWLLQRTDIVVADLKGVFWNSHGPIRRLFESKFHQVEGIDECFALWNKEGMAAFIDFVADYCPIEMKE